MSKLAANIIKGLNGRLHRRNITNSANNISWIKEKILKHQDDIHEKKISLNHFTLHYIRPYEVLHTYTEIFVNEIYKFKSNKDVPVVIDCGANIGMSVIYFKYLYPRSKLIAFEPDPEIYDLLKKNVDNNNLKDVELHKTAVWIEEGIIDFNANASEASHISENTTSNGIQVKTERLANYLVPFEIVDFLKVDIEGAEWKVMMDCAPHLHKIENMFVEYHGKVNETNKLANLIELIHSNGFDTYIKNAADTLKHPFINKTTNTAYDVQLNLFCYKNNH